MHTEGLNKEMVSSYEISSKYDVQELKEMIREHNINKTVSAAVKQIEDIIFIRDTIGLEQLPAGLCDIAKLRLERPEASLKELGEALNPIVGKSGVNHRLRKLSIMAEELRGES